MYGFARGCTLVVSHGGSEHVDEETAAPVDELEAVEQTEDDDALGDAGFCKPPKTSN